MYTDAEGFLTKLDLFKQVLQIVVTFLWGAFLALTKVGNEYNINHVLTFG